MDNQSNQKVSKGLIVLMVFLIIIAISLWGTLIGLYFYSETPDVEAKEDDSITINTEGLEEITDDDFYFEAIEEEFQNKKELADMAYKNGDLNKAIKLIEGALSLKDSQELEELRKLYINEQKNRIQIPETQNDEEEIDLFLSTLDTYIEMSDGVLISIQPHLEDSDWRVIAVTVSDAWYYSEEFEKERFAEITSKTIKEAVKGFNLVEKDKSILVTFFDINGKELATPKAFGEYKIKR